MAQFAGNAHWAEPSPVFALRARPTPLKCKNEYLLLALREETAVQTVAAYAYSFTFFFPFHVSIPGINIKTWIYQTVSLVPIKLPF